MSVDARGTPDASNLGLRLVEGAFGPVCKVAASALVRHGKQSFSDLRRSSGLPPRQLRAALLVLLQHGLAESYVHGDPPNLRGEIRSEQQYAARLDRMRGLLRLPRYVTRVQQADGEAAGRVALALALAGRLTAEQIARTVMATARREAAERAAEDAPEEEGADEAGDGAGGGADGDGDSRHATGAFGGEARGSRALSSDAAGSIAGGGSGGAGAASGGSEPDGDRARTASLEPGDEANGGSGPARDDGSDGGDGEGHPGHRESEAGAEKSAPDTGWVELDDGTTMTAQDVRLALALLISRRVVERAPPSTLPPPTFEAHEKSRKRRPAPKEGSEEMAAENRARRRKAVRDKHEDAKFVLPRDLSRLQVTLAPSPDSALPASSQRGGAGGGWGGSGSEGSQIASETLARGAAGAGSRSTGPAPSASTSWPSSGLVSTKKRGRVMGGNLGDGLKRSPAAAAAAAAAAADAAADAAAAVAAAKRAKLGGGRARATAVVKEEPEGGAVPGYTKEQIERFNRLAEREPSSCPEVAASDVLWRLNYETLELQFRHDVVATFAARKAGPDAGVAMLALLAASKPNEDGRMAKAASVDESLSGIAACRLAPLRAQLDGKAEPRALLDGLGGEPGPSAGGGARSRAPYDPDEAARRGGLVGSGFYWRESGRKGYGLGDGSGSRGNGGGYGGVDREGDGEPSPSAWVPAPRAGLNSRPDLLHRALQALVEAPTAQLATRGNSQGDGSGPPTYRPRLGPALRQMRREALAGDLQARFGGEVARTWCIVESCGALEERTVAELGVLSRPEARRALIQLLERGYARLQDVPKSLDRAPSKTTHLWRAPLDASVARRARDALRAVLRVQARLDHESLRRKELFELGDQVRSGLLPASAVAARSDEIESGKAVMNALEGKLLELDAELALYEELDDPVNRYSEDDQIP